MNEGRAVERWRNGGNDSGSPLPKGLPSDLFELVEGGAKAPAVLVRSLEASIRATEFEGIARARVGATEDAITEAKVTQAASDGETILKAATSGDFGKLANIGAEDIVATATAEHALAQRVYTAARVTARALAKDLIEEAKTEKASDAFENIWQASKAPYVGDSIGEAREHEARADNDRNLLKRIILAVDGTEIHRAGQWGKDVRKALVAAFDEGTSEKLPRAAAIATELQKSTVEKEEEAIAARQAQAEATREANIESAVEAAQARTGRKEKVEVPA